MMGVDIVLILAVFLALLLFSCSRLTAMIRIFACQSFILSFMPFLVHGDRIGVHAFIVTAGMVGVKTLAIPLFLFWAVRNVSVRREDRPLVGFGFSIVLGGILVVVSFVTSKFISLPEQMEMASDLLVPAALTTFLAGFFLLISRTKAITQVIGYLVMENGIYLFGLLILGRMPILVEMGILLDVFVAVFVMTIVINHIHQTFSDVDVAQFTKLRD